MRAAIYARVSTDEQAHSAEAQEREARRYAASRGWEVVALYLDVGASGAEWVTRPEIGRLLREVAATPRPWDVLVVRDQDRIGRDLARTVLAIEAVLESGARVVEYSTGHEAKSDPMARAMMSMRGVFGETERAMIAKRTRDAHLAMAREGRVTGGLCYGYRNVRTAAGVHHEIDEAQAAVVREVYELAAGGMSARRIAIDLNRRGVPSPRAGARGSGSWAATVLHLMLHNCRYVGVIEWGRKRKSYRAGTRVRTDQADADVVAIERPELRIVPDDLWQRVRARDNAALVAGGRPKRRGASPRHLLVGHAVCAKCGGRIAARTSRWGTEKVFIYYCAQRHERGESVCDVASTRPVSMVDAAVADWLRAQLLVPAHAREILAEARRIMEAEAVAVVDVAEIARVERELRRLDQETARLTEAVASAEGAVGPLVRALQEREAKATALRVELARLTTAKVSPDTVPWAELEAVALTRLEEFRELMGRGVAEARAVLAEVLDGPMRFKPAGTKRGAGWHLYGLFRTGVMVVSPAGVTHNPCSPRALKYSFFA